MSSLRTKTYSYAVYYSDNSYMIYDFVPSDIKAFTKHLLDGNTSFLELSIGLFNFKDIRAIIKQKDKEDEEAYIPQLEDADPELPFSVKSYLNELRGVERY